MNHLKALTLPTTLTAALLCVPRSAPSQVSINIGAGCRLAGHDPLSEEPNNQRARSRKYTRGRRFPK